MRQGLPENPKVMTIVKRASAQFVTDINAALPDAHPENIRAGKVREKNLILRRICCVCGDRKNMSRFVSDQAFDWLIFDNGDTRHQ
jgi:hypothetical protein